MDNDFVRSNSTHCGTNRASMLNNLYMRTHNIERPDWICVEHIRCFNSTLSSGLPATFVPVCNIIIRVSSEADDL